MIKNILTTLLLSAIGMTATAGDIKDGRSADNGDGTFTNPILWGDWPDPDVIRVGEDFYMVSTIMHYVPGCPVLKSKDLVNWEMAGYAVDRYDEDPRYDMDGGDMYLRGSWANSIRYHNGKFYVAFCTPNWDGEPGRFSLCEAENVSGPWKRTIFPDYLYDPGLFFDEDGSAYVIHGQGRLMVSRLSEDLHSVVGEPVVIWNERFTLGRELGGGYGMEGSHMYKINGKYYLTCPAGGTEGWQVCLKSDNIYGPYEYKIIMDDDRSYPGNGLHQGGMVELADGDWWFIIMQDRGPIGRVAHLQPVTWIDGWPMLGDNGKDLITYSKPSVDADCPLSWPAGSDDFSSSSLGLQWQWNHNPDTTRFSLTERPGYIRLRAGRSDSLKYARNTLTQRVQGPTSEGTVKIDFSGLKDGDIAGFGVFEFPYAYVAVKSENGKRQIIMCENDEIIETKDISAGQTQLFVRARISDKDFSATFSYSTDGVTYHRIGKPLSMDLGLTWTANRFALFNFSTTDEGVGGYVDFDSFNLIMN